MTRVDEMLNLLAQEEERFNRMFALKLAERSCLATGDYAGLEASTCSIERVSHELEEIEAQRIGLTRQLAGQFDLPEEEMTLSRLAEQVDPPDRGRLTSAIQRMGDITHRLELQNLQNATMLRENLAVVHEAVLSLADSGERELEAYGANGAVPGRAGREARLLDRRA